VKFLKNLKLDLDSLDGHELRGRKFYDSIVKYRAEVLKKFKHRILQNEQHKCPLCGGYAAKQVLEWESGYLLRECESCGAYSPNIDFQDASSHITSVYASAEYQSKFIREIHNQFEYRKKVFGVKRADYVMQKVGNTADPTVLDVGCGAGYFLAELKDRGIKYRGLEVADDLVRYCRETRGLNVVQTSIEEEPDSAYDVITMFDVLEHLTDPVRVFKHVNRKLKPGGICIAYTPNINSVAYQLMGAKQNTLLPFEHVCFYSAGSFERLAELTNFQVTSLETFGLDLIDYFMEKEFDLREEFIQKFSDMTAVVQGVIDASGYANHFRVVFLKK
jgi:2-polyprenyl-3-methyl-5-hydroxy-6-metoxy-1,4-benzoquinol methylase